MMPILAAGHGLDQSREAVLTRIAQQRGPGLVPRLLGPGPRLHGVGQPVIGEVLRQRLAEVDEVAVQVDILVRHPPAPGEAVRIDRVDQHHGHVRRPLRRLAASQPVDLGPGTTVPFDTMRAGHQDQHACRVRRADPGHVGGQLATLGPSLGMRIGRQRHPRRRRGVQELCARLGVRGAERGLSHQTRTIRLPRFSPASRPISACGRFSRPSMTSSCTLSWPEATQD